MVEQGVRVEEDDDRVLLDGAPDDRGLLPRVATVTELAALDEVVAVAMNFRCGR